MEGDWNDRNDKGGRLDSWCCQGAEGKSPCLSLKLHRRDEPRIPLTLQCRVAEDGEVRASEARHYPILPRSKLPCYPMWLGRGVCSDSSQYSREHSVLHHSQGLPGFPNCQVDGAKIVFALWCQAPAQRMCIYFSKLCKLTQQIVAAWEEKVKHRDFMSTKIHRAKK